MRCSTNPTSKTRRAQITLWEAKLASQGTLRLPVVGELLLSLSLLFLSLLVDYPCGLDSPVQEVPPTWVVFFPPFSFSFFLSLVDSPVQEVLPRVAHFPL